MQGATIRVASKDGQPENSISLIKEAHIQLAEATIQNGESQFHRILEKLPAGAYICDAQGLITYYNPQSVQLWGRAPKLNDSLDRFCGSFKLYATDGTPITHDQCWMALALKTDQDYIGQEIIIERPDGKRVTGLAHASPLHDESGKLIGAVNILVDITERKQAEIARAHLAAIVESSEDAIISKTFDGIIRSWNKGAEKVFGYTAQEAIGQSILLLIPPERHSEEDHILGRLRKGERVEHYETIRRHKDGHELDISLTISPIRDGSGNIIGASKIARDIGVQKKAEKILRESDQRKDEFLAVLAHELRNPLAPLRNALHILQSPQASEEVRLQATGMMERQVNHMVRLVDDLLDVSRITCGKVELHKKPLILTDVIHSAVETSRPLIEECGHHLTIDLPSDPILLNADLVRLSQVFSNLLNNAAKYTQGPGSIQVKAKRLDDEVVITIQDTGIGIAPEMLPYIFDMFAQVSSSLERAQGGLGIGLTLVKNLVQMHGGKVEAKSEGLNKGSQFIVKLPVSEQSALKEKNIPAQNLPIPSTAVLRVLVVDDNEASAKTMGWTMELLFGHEIRLAHDGQTAIELAHTFVPHVILLDIGLPDMNGYEICRCMRKDPKLQHTLFVAQTGWGQSEHRRLSKEAGFDHHLVKPIPIETLQELLATIDVSRLK